MVDYDTTIKAGDFQALFRAVQDILDLPNERSSLRLPQKWVFVDFVHLLFKAPTKLSRLDPKTFAATYSAFDKDRLAYTAAPQDLLIG